MSADCTIGIPEGERGREEDRSTDRVPEPAGHPIIYRTATRSTLQPFCLAVGWSEFRTRADRQSYCLPGSTHADAGANSGPSHYLPGPALPPPLTPPEQANHYPNN